MHFVNPNRVFLIFAFVANAKKKFHMQILISIFWSPEKANDVKPRPELKSDSDNLL